MERYRAGWLLEDGRTGTVYQPGDVVPSDFPGIATLKANGGVLVELVPDPAPAPSAPAPSTAASVTAEIPEPPAPTTGTNT